MCFFFSSSCEEGGAPSYDVELEFQEYVDRFIAEAAARGQEIDFTDSGLSIQFRDAVSKESGGVCYLGQHRIEIEKFFWDDANDAQREGLIFHELGHCELDRRHRNDLLPNGEWLSRMRGDPIPDGQTVPVNTFGTRREYYVDELFDRATPVPDWASWTFNYDDIDDSKRQVLTEVTDASGTFRESLGTAPSLDFELEVEVKLGGSESWVGFQWGSLEGNQAIQIAFRGSKRFLITSGNEIYGTFRDIERLDILKGADEYNKLTLRKVGQLYHLFVNEEFVYWFDFIQPATTNFVSITAGQTRPEFNNIRISRLLP
ncbi:MAG: putative metallopeptidase [Bacteroidota bacterium]